MQCKDKDNMTEIGKTYNSKDKKYILEKVARLTHTEHEEIFKIIKSASVPFTQNKNGLFINLTQVDNCVIEKIDNFVDFCLKNKKELDEYDKRIIECKMTKSFDILAASGGVNMPHQATPSDEKKQLNDILNSVNDDATREDWHKVLQQTKEDQKIASFVSHLEENFDKVHKKKGCMKFINAKKKFARKLASSDKHDMISVLEQEAYLCCRVQKIEA